MRAFCPPESWTPFSPTSVFRGLSKIKYDLQTHEPQRGTCRISGVQHPEVRTQGTGLDDGIVPTLLKVLPEQDILTNRP